MINQYLRPYQDYLPYRLLTHGYTISESLLNHHIIYISCSVVSSNFCPSLRIMRSMLGQELSSTREGGLFECYDVGHNKLVIQFFSHGNENKQIAQSSSPLSFNIPNTHEFTINLLSPLYINALFNFWSSFFSLEQIY